MTICAGCKLDITNARETGSSSIYHPGGPDIELCIDCFWSEDELCNGGNFHPDLLQKYYTNLGWGNRPKLYDVMNNRHV